MSVMRFTISGPAGEQQLAYDWAQDITAADLWALEEMGMTADILENAIERADDIAQAAATGDRSVLNLSLRVMCALAFLAHRRDGNDTPWKDYARGINPGSFKVVGMDHPPVNRAERRAATKPAAKRNGKTSTVGAALADAGASIEGPKVDDPAPATP
jgi:hypothetical protein